MPCRFTVWKWLNQHEEFASRYARARDLRKEALAERLMHLAGEALAKADEGAETGNSSARVQAVKLEMDAIKWILSKEYARDYGEKIAQEISGPGGGPVKTEKILDDEQQQKLDAWMADIERECSAETAGKR